MSEETTQQTGNIPVQPEQTQPTVNRLLTRPMNPKLDIVVKKSFDKPIERVQEGAIERKQNGGMVTEQKQDNPPSKE